ncbi:growth factor receptor-bound protein 7 isoform X2 [Hippocampus comes]|uniref:growth factor receptor-bound protein 7 isoform X2 n=1 Tax=Hippocampus comes TaxID=109280 RepID=UPI00094F34F1|nr:PREDICTED: growth factor receptor-bound protein 7-like isoform X2 [Hippocampus comes]
MSRKESLEDDVTRPEAHRSQPINIAGGAFVTSRSNWRERLSSSAPPVPNPFPELCGLTRSPVPSATASLAAGDKRQQQQQCQKRTSEPSKWSPQNLDEGKLLKVFGEDEHGRSLRVSDGATAMDVCRMLMTTGGCSEREHWALMEVHPALGLERCLEDHEAVLEVQASWAVKAETRLVFCKNYAKYEFFRKPALFFPDAMISDSADGGKPMTSQQLVQDLVHSGSCPEIQGFLHLKDSTRKSWKRAHFFLRRSGLYCSTKGASKEPRHLQYVADLRDLHVYNVVNARKLYAAPQNFCFAITSSGSPVRLHHVKMLCADSEQTRTCWTSAFRLFKYGKQLQCNFQQSKWTHRGLEGTNLMEGKAKSEANLVAMDFSGSSGGRVIENPSEAECAEWQEGRARRRREALRCSLPNLSSASGPPLLHAGQAWFHGNVSRKRAETLIEEQGLVDGTFLIRVSQRHAQCFVLSLCFELKTKHFLVIPCEDGGRQYLTMDDGVTVFTDLLQLVDFHQINKGILPVCLKRPCVCVAL